MARKKENIIEQLHELTGYFWPVGFVVTLIMAVGTGWSISWCLSDMVAGTGPAYAAISKLLVIRWLAPMTLAVLTFLFASKTFSAWKNS